MKGCFVCIITVFAVQLCAAQQQMQWMTGLSIGKSGRYFWDEEELGFEAKAELQYLLPNHWLILNLAMSSGRVVYQEDRHTMQFATEQGNPWNAYYFDGIYVEPVLPRTRTKYVDLQLETQVHPLGKWFFQKQGWVSPFVSAGVGLLGHHIAANVLNGEERYSFASPIPFRDIDKRTLETNSMSGFLQNYDPPQAIIPASETIDWDNSYESPAPGYSTNQWLWNYSYDLSFSFGLGLKARINEQFHIQAVSRLNGIARTPVSSPAYQHFRFHWSTTVGLVYRIARS